VNSGGAAGDEKAVERVSMGAGTYVVIAIGCDDCADLDLVAFDDESDEQVDDDTEDDNLPIVAWTIDEGDEGTVRLEFENAADEDFHYAYVLVRVQ
ncbi:hypothetical protein OAX78_04300, partial [Planctomycetota bacterium]|nr:hypothetical protein [Planctomycetota bacterium]